MKTLHFYVLRQAVTTLAMTVCVFAFILLLGNALKEILSLLVNRQATLGLVFKAIYLLMPWILGYVLPFALLTAMLLLFGRLSADNELTAVKASGISLLSLVTPLLIFGLLVSALCAWFNMTVTPQSRVAYKKLFFELAVQSTDTLITEDRFIDEIEGVILYVRKKDGDRMQDLCIYRLEKGEIVTRTSAARGRILWDRPGGKIEFELEDAIIEQRNFREMDVTEPGQPLAVSNFFETNVLQAVVSNALPGRVIGKWKAAEWQPVQGGSIIYPVGVPKAGPTTRKLKLKDMTFAELSEELKKRRDQGISLTPVLVQLHRMAAFSFASFAFTLVAIPLGIRAHRRETSIGMAMALVMLVFYYSFLILSEALQAREHLSPHLIVWIPNFLFQGVGAYLLWRANRMG